MRKLTAWLVGGAFLVSAVEAGDWPSWRGPEHNGVSRESSLPEHWQVLWKTSHGGRSTPVVFGDHVYILNSAGRGIEESERLLCLHRETGDVIWEHRFNVFLTDIPSPRIGWSSPVVDPETGHVYAHGVQNTILCVSKDGKLLWQRQMHEEYGTINGYGGRTHTPIIDEDRVIISFLNSSWGPHARGRHRYVAFDKRNGSVIWWSEPGGAPLDTTYSTPVVAVIGGVRLLIGGNADGAVYALQARTGKSVWKFSLSKRGINVSVIVWKEKVYACHSEENVDQAIMGRVVCIDATGSGDVTKTHEVWRRDGILAGYSSPALKDGKLYVCDNSSNLYCLDALSGDELWEENIGTVMKGSPVVGDGKIYVGEVNARFYLLDEAEIEQRAAARKRGNSELEPLEPLQTFAAKEAVVEVFGSPAIANGRVYFTTRDEVYCLGDKEWKGTSGETAKLAEEKPAAADAKGAQLQILPADVLAQPGDQVTFRARVFDADGRLLKESVRPQWGLAMGLVGDVNAEGKLALNAAEQYRQGVVVGRHGDLEQRARVRVVPRLPLGFDFDDLADGKPPPAWVGAGIKFVGKTHGGHKVLHKTATNSKFIDAETFIGMPGWKDYTIEADVLGTEKRRNLPNIGVINSRYTFVLMGNHQRLRIVSWIPQPRLSEQIKFEWKKDTWYRMKFSVENRDGIAVARGKVWPRDETEPAEWMVSVEDPNPNGEGSPGLHGYSAGTTSRSSGTEIYYDNVKVYPNK